MSIEKMAIDLKCPANGGGYREIFLDSGKNFRFGLEGELRKFAEGLEM